MNSDCDKFLNDYIRASKACMDLIEDCEIENAGRSRWKITSSSYGNCKQIPTNCVYDLRKYKSQYERCVR